MGTLLPQQVIKALPTAAQSEILGKAFFPNLLTGPFKDGLVIAFWISAALALVAAVVSFMRGERVIYGASEEGQNEPVPITGPEEEETPVEEKVKQDD